MNVYLFAYAVWPQRVFVADNITGAIMMGPQFADKPCHRCENKGPLVNLEGDGEKVFGIRDPIRSFCIRADNMLQATDLAAQYRTDRDGDLPEEFPENYLENMLEIEYLGTLPKDPGAGT